MTAHRWLLLILLAAGGPFLCLTAVGAEYARYGGVFTDGSRAEGKELSGWSSGVERLRLDGAELFGSSRSIRWLRDRSLLPTETPGDAGAFVEFTNGDRLPGNVVNYRQLQTDDSFGDRGHLLVVLSAPLSMPGRPDMLQLRVLPRFIRRIAWRKNEGAFPPSTLVYRDGREVSFQALRWQPDGVEVLVQDGIRQVAFAELAEVVLPLADPWQTYCEELARTNPDLSAPLFRLETAAGMIVTASESACRRGGKEPERGNWHYLLRPAWTLDPLPVMFAAVRTRWHFAVHELPLWRLRPVRAVERALLGQGRPWQADRNVQRGPLRNKTLEHGWGFGVHAPYELWFEIPRHAQALRTRVGLDALAGDGGCARALVYLNKCEGSPLYRSNLLIGSSAVADTGNVALTATGDGPKTLILAADAAARDGPPGSDPLDIRDMLDWIEPMLLLDLERLKTDVQARNDAPLVADGWTAKVEGGAAPRWRAGFEEIEPGLVKLFRGLFSDGRPLTLARQQEIPATADGLLLSMRQASGGSPGRLEVRVDGRPVARCDLPVRDQGLPLFVSLKPYSGRKVNLEVVYQPGSGSELLDVRWLAWANRASLSFWKPVTPTDAWSLFRQLPIEIQNDGSVRVGRSRPDADIQVMQAETERRQIQGFRLEFMPEGELFQPGDPNDVFRLGVSLAVAPRVQTPVPGRYVRIEVPPKAKYPISLAEVEVYRESVFPPVREKDRKAIDKDPKAKPEKPRPAPLNMARKGEASQSSVEGEAFPRRGIDGSWQHAATRSAESGDPSPWWEVDLGEMKPIDRIVVQKTQDVWRQRPYWVLVLDDHRNTVWRTYVDSLVHTEDLQVMPTKDLLVGPRPAAGAEPALDPAKPATAYSLTYWSSRPPGSCEPLCFFPEKAVELSDKESLLVTLKQVGRRGGQILGHFRLWVTVDRVPRGAETAAVEVPLLP